MGDVQNSEVDSKICTNESGIMAFYMLVVLDRVNKL
jgi:hypothetical protein